VTARSRRVHHARRRPGRPVLGRRPSEPTCGRGPFATTAAPPPGVAEMLAEYRAGFATKEG